MPKYQRQKGPDTYPIHCEGKRVSPVYRKGFRPRWRCECGAVFLRAKKSGRRVPSPTVKTDHTNEAPWWEQTNHVGLLDQEKPWWE